METIQINGRGFIYWDELKIHLPYEAEITAFYAYTSMTRKRIIEMEYAHNDSLSKLRDNMIVLARQSGIDAYLDNKTVFEVTHMDGGKLYFGWYDGKFSIGLDVWTERAENERRIRR